MPGSVVAGGVVREILKALLCQRPGLRTFRVNNAGSAVAGGVVREIFKSSFVPEAGPPHILRKQCQAL